MNSRILCPYLLVGEGPEVLRNFCLCLLYLCLGHPPVVTCHIPTRLPAHRANVIFPKTFVGFTATLATPSNVVNLLLCHCITSFWCRGTAKRHGSRCKLSTLRLGDSGCVVKTPAKLLRPGRQLLFWKNVL